MNLAGIDLNLLVVFDALIAERSATRAGRRIGLSQPAVSNALARLRANLGDELFVRSPDGMRPTPRALELAAPVSAALRSLEEALDPAGFDPKTARRAITLVTNDYGATVVLPPVAERLCADAPGIDLRLTPQIGRTLDALDAQEADFGLGGFGDLPERFERMTLIRDDYVVLMRRAHPLAEGALDLDAFSAADHLLMTPRGDPTGFVDAALARLGRARRIRMTVNQFAAGPPLLAGSNMVMTVPKRIADLYAPLFGLTTRPAPVSGPSAFGRPSLIWRRNLATHPAHVWFRALLRELFPDPTSPSPALTADPDRARRGQLATEDRQPPSAD